MGKNKTDTSIDNENSLSLEELSLLLKENRYPVSKMNRFKSRCVDGRYQNEESLPPQAYPGGDLGLMAAILAAGRSFGFDLDREKAFQTLLDVVSGWKNFGFHSDSHANPEIIASGCGHFSQMRKDPSSYSLEKEDLVFLENMLERVKKEGGEEVVLEGDHKEIGALLIKGDFSVKPRFKIQTDDGEKKIQVFVFHQSLTDEKIRLLSKKLIENKAVNFRDGENEEFLIHALQETTENHLFETLRRLAKGLPIYEVVFNEDGDFSLFERGEV